MYQKLGTKQINQQKFLLQRLPHERLLRKSMKNVLTIARFYGITPAQFQLGHLPGLK